MKNSDHKDHNLYRVIKKIISIYYKGSIYLSKDGGWRKKWRRHKRAFFLNKATISENMKQFRRRYLQEGFAEEKLKRYQTDYLLCLIFLTLTADEYFQYDFMHKNWLWRNHHVTIERRKLVSALLSPDEYRKEIADKLLFNEFYQEYLHRKWCNLKEIDKADFIEFANNAVRIIVKPTWQSGGKGIEAYDIREDDMEDVYEQYQKMKGEFVCEEFLHQTGFLHDINPSSLNTIRVITIRKDDDVRVIDSYFRCGCGDAVVDNFSNGGILFPIDLESGILRAGHSAKEIGILEHPLSKIRIEGEKVPDWEMINTEIKKVHQKTRKGINIVGWDVCVIEGSITLIEANSIPGFTEIYSKDYNLWKIVKRYLPNS